MHRDSNKDCPRNQKWNRDHTCRCKPEQTDAAAVEAVREHLARIDSVKESTGGNDSYDTANVRGLMKAYDQQSEELREARARIEELDKIVKAGQRYIGSLSDEDRRVDLLAKDEYRKTIDKLRAQLSEKDKQLAAAIELAIECDDYLETNDQTYIGHGSILHRKLKALREYRSDNG